MKLYREILKQIKKYHTIVIARHIGADPDALGSQFALKELIKVKKNWENFLGILKVDIPDKDLEKLLKELLNDYSDKNCTITNLNRSESPQNECCSKPSIQTNDKMNNKDIFSQLKEGEKIKLK